MSSARSRRSTGGRSKSPDYLTGDAPGLRRIVQKRLLEDVFDGASAKDPNWKILVVDDTAMKVTSAAVGMYDIMERKVTLVESLDKKRAPFPDMGVIYLLDPTSDSVSKLIADFSGKSVLYGGSVFLYFLARLPDRLLDQIKVCKPLLKRLKCLVEVNIDFLAVQERAFTLQMRDSFTSLYLRRSKSPAEGEIADKLVTVCATLNEYPHIRYRDSSANARSLASIFHVKMDQFVSQNPTWWYHGGPSRKSSQSGAAKRDRGVLLLVDRADDCLTPLMHDFTYQAMVRDLLPLQGDRITYQNETTNDPTQTEARDVLLDERDKLWVELRSKHIALVIETLSSRIREIMNSSTGSSLSKKSASGNLSLSQMAAALKALPEYKEVMSKLSQHMHISHECMDLFRNQRLLDLSELEQTLATGKDEDGRSPKLTDMLERVEDELIRIKSKEGRLRLILVTIVSQGGLGSSERRRLMNAAELTRKDQRTLNALEILGMSIFNSSNKSGGAMSSMFGSRLAGSAQSDDEAEYAASRFVPALKTSLTDMAQEGLSFDAYPSVLPMPEATPASGGSSRGGSKSARSGRRGEASSARKTTGASSKWAKSSGGSKSGSGGPVRFMGGRHIVFMIGGMSYAEVRAAEEVSVKESREIIIGSTCFVTPAEYMEDLALLGQDED